ncbi:MAG: penicillin-binding protein transpeptidase [Acidimicrobiales bacterium]|nr:penicillin-binding protein transpeptidase [Acidimicrobiales bacterium]
MNRQIRRLGIAALVLFLALFVQLNNIQVLSAKRLNDNRLNTRNAVRDFSQPRGVIQTADGVVVADSVPTGDTFQRLRRYPTGPLFAHITGYFSFTFGSEGVERTYNKELTGKADKLKLNNIGDLLLDKKRTANVTLTLTNKLQQVATQALGARKGAVVALDPRNGAVLALADFPSFDPSPLAAHDQKVVRDAWARLSTDANKPLLPRTYRDRYFPGSTFKIVTAATALTNGATTTQPVVPTLTQLPLPNTGGQVLKNFGGESCGGALPQILAISCNTAFAQLGLDLGGQKLAAGADAFGFNEAPPLDLPAVARSLFPPASTFVHDKPALAKSAIGQQDVQASPLEMALTAGAIANGGVAMTPHVMGEVRDSEGQLIEKFKPDQWKKAISPGVASTMRDLMIGVVQNGTATRVAIPGTQVAAKTGTAQTGNNTSHTWMVAFAPADAPRVVVAVIVENQPNVSEATGGVVAAPIARAVLQAALATP